MPMGVPLVWPLFVLVILALVAGTLPAGAETGDTTQSASIADASDEQPVVLPEVVVQGREDSLLSIASSASQGSTGVDQLVDRPLLRSGEILESIPGVIITQHAGGGKANQYFLRGFNLDHGTDFAVFLDGMPLNLPSHAHGEGYADMNIVIPEFVERIDWEKGPYFADVGNFGSAGSAHLVTREALQQNFCELEAGSFGYERLLIGYSAPISSGNVLVGSELTHDDGPWDHPDDYRKFNGLLTYSQGTSASGFSVTARVYDGRWSSSDQVPEDFASHDFFGTLNPTDGGYSDRESVQVEWHSEDGSSQDRILLYGFHYYLNLFSDFTYYLIDPLRGDQFEQADDRWVGGLDARRTTKSTWTGGGAKNTVGLQVRSDWVDNGLYQTEDRVRTDKLDSETGTVLPATTEADSITDVQVGLYAESQIQWNRFFRCDADVRGDWEYADVHSLVEPRNTGAASAGLFSPKLSLVFGPWQKTEFYLQAGYSFHSNDARGSTQTIEPVSADNPYPGTPSESIPLLIRTRGAEVGIRTLVLPRGQSTLSLWCLHSNSELQQDGDTGSTVPSRSPSNRWGIEWANYYAVTSALALDLDAACSVARFDAIDATDASPGSAGGMHVPEAAGAVVASGATYRFSERVSSSLRLRYFGPRDLTSDGVFRSSSTTLLNAQTAYRIDRTWAISLEALNLFNRRDHDIDYAYMLRQSPTAAAGFERVLHPVEPFQIRVGVAASF